MHNFGKQDNNLYTMTREKDDGLSLLAGAMNSFDNGEEEIFSITLEYLDDENIMPYVGCSGAKRI